MAYIPSNNFNYVASNYTPSVHFVYLNDLPPAGVISATLDDVSGAFNAETLYTNGVITATLDDVSGVFNAEYDANISQWLTINACSDAQNASPLLLNSAISVQQSQLTITQTRAESASAQARYVKTKIATDACIFASVKLNINADSAFMIIDKTELTVEQASFVHSTFCSTYAAGVMLTHITFSELQQMTKIYPDKWSLPIHDSSVERHDVRRLVQLKPLPDNQYAPGSNFLYTPGNYTPSHGFNYSYGRTGYMSTMHAVGIISSAVHSDFQIASSLKTKYCENIEDGRQPDRGASKWIDYPRPEPDPDPPSGANYIVPVQEVYTMQHSSSVTLEDLTDIDMDNISLKFDADSFAWSFSADLLDAAQLSLVEPPADAPPIKLIVTINGYVWHILSENVSHNRTFENESISIAGRGISSLLAAPNKLATSGTQGTLLGVQQLADLHIPFDWTLDWQAPVWNVTGGAYSWQDRTPLQAIADIASAAGAMLIPARDSQTITVKPRYPVLPWNFDYTNVDVAIPDAAILQVVYRQRSHSHPNGVYVHGSETGGQLAFSRLNGSAGDVLLPTQSNSLMTDVVGLRALSERLLAGEYTQPKVRSFKTEMDGTLVPLMEVGSYVGVTIGGVETRGIVNSVDISVSGSGVEQTVVMGEETSNQWVAFKSLLPQDPLLVGTITSTTGSTSIIQLIDGGVLTVRGTGGVNDKVYIRSGQIQGAAPNLVQNNIVI